MIHLNLKQCLRKLFKRKEILEATQETLMSMLVTQIRIGPAVTQYEVQPAQGVKVNKIVNLTMILP